MVNDYSIIPTNELSTYDVDKEIEGKLYFQNWVYKLVNDGRSYMEAVLEFCQVFGIDEENINVFMTSDIRDMLYNEVIEDNIMRPSKEYEQRVF
jgi:hypothetical protein